MIRRLLRGTADGIRHPVRTLGRYRVTIGFCALFVTWTLVLRWHYGDGGGTAALADLGFGLPALEDGRWWTLATGVPFSGGLGLVPQWQTIVGLALCERAFGHVRTIVVFVAGHVVAVLVVSGLLWLADPAADPWLRTLAATVDNGSSIGGFAVLGAWTATLARSWRRWWRVGLGCYLATMLALSGHVYDATHLVGFATGVLLGRSLTGGRAHGTGAPWVGTVIAVGVGVAAGTWLGWTGGGNGGPFGWGPGHLA